MGAILKFQIALGYFFELIYNSPFCQEIKVSLFQVIAVFLNVKLRYSFFFEGAFELHKRKEVEMKKKSKLKKEIQW